MCDWPETGDPSHRRLPTARLPENGVNHPPRAHLPLHAACNVLAYAHGDALHP